MKQEEHDPALRPTDQSNPDMINEGDLSASSKIDPYKAVLTIYQARVEQLEQQGLVRRPSEIVDEWELEDHWDDLRRLYRQTCLEMGLTWPPPLLSDGDIDRCL
jgi:hypothetical protein